MYKNETVVAEKTKEATRCSFLYKDLYSKIISGRFNRGQRLPTEVELCQQYKISRGSVRNALSRLEMEGIILKRAGSGTYVSDDLKLKSPSNGTTELIWVHSNFELINHPSSRGLQFRDGLLLGAMFHNFRLLFEYSSPGQSVQLKPVSGADIGGVITVQEFRPDNPLPDAIESIPSILVNKRATNPAIPSIDIDNEIGAFQATRSLLHLGHREIMFLISTPVGPVMEHRMNGYRRAFKMQGLDVNESMFISEDRNAKDWPSIWPQLLRTALRQRPTALLFNNLGRAIHLLDIIKSEGYKIPDDLSVIAFDEDPGFIYNNPKISFVRQPMEQMGRQAIDMLAELKQNGSIKDPQRRLYPELVMWNSIAPNIK